MISAVVPATVHSDAVASSVVLSDAVAPATTSAIAPAPLIDFQVSETGRAGTLVNLVTARPIIRYCPIKNRYQFVWAHKIKF